MGCALYTKGFLASLTGEYTYRKRLKALSGAYSILKTPAGDMQNLKNPHVRNQNSSTQNVLPRRNQQFPTYIQSK